MVRRVLKLVAFTGALCGGGLLAASMHRESVDGSGVKASEDRPVGAVTAVDLSGTGDLTILTGEPGLTVTADDNVLPLIQTDTDGGTLKLRPKSRTEIRTRTKIEYTLTVPRLSAITMSGAGNVTVRDMTTGSLTVKLSGSNTAKFDNLACKSLSLNLSGAGSAKASGSTERLTVRVSGSGEVDTSALKSTIADVQVTGSGHAAVFATLELKARASGSGDVTYKGRPHVDQKASGSGRVRYVE